MAAQKKKAAKRKTSKKVSAPRAKKARSKKGSKGGRPAFKFGADALKALKLLASRANSIADAATLLGVSKSTLERRLGDEKHPAAIAWAAGAAEMRESLRAAQFKNALDNDHPTLQIWLGKQLLGQRDFKAIEVSGPGGGPISVDSSGEILDLLGQKIKELQRSRRKVDVDLPD